MTHMVVDTDTASFIHAASLAEGKALPDEMRKLRISLASRTVKVDALQARNQPEIDLIVAQNSAAIAAFRLVQSQDKNATDRVAAASRLDETIEKLTVAMVRIKIADSRDLSQDRLQTEAQLQIVADSSLTEELQRAYDLAEIARNAALTKLLESEGARVRRIAQTGDFRGLAAFSHRGTSKKPPFMA